jgi:tRNA G18 (ribose-2'-O)-methylase SpoU
MLVVGGEKRGISASLLAECTDRIKIDYARYAGSSLSAVSAAAVIAYEIAEKNGKLIKND